MRRVHGEIGDQGLGETLHRELGGAVGGVRHARAERGPEAVDAAGIDNVRLVGRLQHRQERPGAEIDPAPADVEGPLPLVARSGDDAAATTDPGVVEQQMDVVEVEVAGQMIAEIQDLVLVGDVRHIGADPCALGRIGLAL